MKKMTFSAKLVGGFMVTGLILLIGGLVGVYGISQVNRELQTLSEVNFAGIYNIGAVREAQIERSFFV